LFVAVVEQHMDHIFRAVSATLPEDPPVRETLRAFGLSILDVTLARAIPLLRVVSVEAGRFPTLARTLFARGPERGTATLTRYLAAQVARGRLRDGDCARMAEHLIGLLIGGAVLWYALGLAPHLPPPDERRRHVEAAVDAFLRAYGATA